MYPPDEQERILDHERFIQKILAFRSGGNAKPRWQIFMESTGGAALITVLLGGVAGAWITGLIQQRGKERELALVGYEEFSRKRLETVTSAYEAVGSVLSASDTLIALTSEAWTIEAPIASEQEKINSQKEALRERVNEAVMHWVREREALGFLIAYYHPSMPQVYDTWSKVMLAVDQTIACAQKWHLEHSATPAAIEGVCRPEKENMRSAWTTLTSQLGRSDQVDPQNAK